jgi:uncharacterized membrane protein YcaP (DUF421 family)
MPSLPEIGSSLPEVALRTAIVYVFLVIAIRVSGKREVGQMSVLELIVVLIISDAVQNSMVGDNTSIWSGIVAVIILLGLDIVLREISRRSPGIRKAVEGEPRLLIRDGRLLKRAIEDEGLGLADVRQAIREHGLVGIEDVQMAVLETDGTISVVGRAPEGEPGPTQHPPDRPGPAGRGS